MTRTITLPFTKEVIQEIRIWDQLLLNGKILVGRDQVHRRIDSLTLKGEQLPVDLDGSALYYMGPARARTGDVIGSCGPTTSARMDPFTPLILSLGVKALIGRDRGMNRWSALLLSTEHCISVPSADAGRCMPTECCPRRSLPSTTSDPRHCRSWKWLISRLSWLLTALETRYSEKKVDEHLKGDYHGIGWGNTEQDGI